MSHQWQVIVCLMLCWTFKPASAGCNSSLTVYEISEAAPPGQSIQALDSSYGSTLLGAASPESVCYFEIAGSALRLFKAFDLENFTSCVDGSTVPKSSGILSAATFTVQCSASSDAATFLIRLVDVNEFPPLFQPNYFRVNISEAAVINTLVIQMNSYVTDRDKSNQLTFNFNIQSGSQSTFGIIDGITSGIVRLTRALDYDAGPRQYVMTVAAAELSTEGASLPAALTGYATLVVDVLDYDDQNPAFGQNSYALFFMENSTDYVNTPLTTDPPLVARDLDVGINQTVNYAIVSGFWSNVAGSEIGNFTFLSINQSTGQLKVLDLIDRESLPSSQMIVLVKAFQTDKPDTRVTLTLVTVTIGDKNDNPPVMSADVYAAAIAENSPAGSYVTRVSATDRDLGENATFRFHLSDPSGAFQIDPISGQVTVANSSILDRETVASFNMTVWAEESSTPERFASPASRLTVALLDVNDNSPAFSETSSYYNASVSRLAPAGATVATVTATDPDDGANGQVVLSLTFVSPSAGGHLFAVNATTGAVTTTGDLSTAPHDQYAVGVAAADSAEPPSMRRYRSTYVLVWLIAAPATTPAAAATTAGTSVTTPTTTTATTPAAPETTDTSASTSTPAAPATSPAPTESWNATVSLATVWMINSSHALAELRTTHRSSGGNQSVSAQFVVMPVNASLLEQTTTTTTTTTPTTTTSTTPTTTRTSTTVTTPTPTTTTMMTSAPTTPEMTPSETTGGPISSEWTTASSVNDSTTSTANDAATSEWTSSMASTTTEAQWPSPQLQPPPVALIAACALLALLAIALAIVLVWCWREKSRLGALAAKQALTIDGLLSTKTNPIFYNGDPSQELQQQQHLGPDSADGADTVDAREMATARGSAVELTVNEAAVDLRSDKDSMPNPDNLDNNFNYRFLPAFITMRTSL